MHLKEEQLRLRGTADAKALRRQGVWHLKDRKWALENRDQDSEGLEATVYEGH